MITFFSSVGCRSDSDCSSQQACLNRQCVPVCSPDGSCGTGAVCHGVNHLAVCVCPPGMTGNAQVGCVYVQCESNSDCPSDKTCINSKCESPCAEANPCTHPAECKAYNHLPSCVCPPGLIGNLEGGCDEGTPFFLQINFGSLQCIPAALFICLITLLMSSY